MLTKIRVMLIIVAMVLTVLAAWALTAIDGAIGVFLMTVAGIVWLVASIVCPKARFF